MKKAFQFISLMVVAVMLLTACGTAATPTAAPVMPTAVPPTAVPPTAVPPTEVPPTAVPPTAVPPKPTNTPVPAPNCAKLADAPAAPAAGKLGAWGSPITIAFVPSGEAAGIATASSAIADCLDKMTGLTYAVQTGTSYAAAIEAMGAGKAQVGFLNTFSILAAQAKYGIIPALINLRKYSTNDLDSDKALGGQLEPFYKGQFITNNPSIKTIADLKGKTFCYVDPLSTSGYIIPRIIFKAHGLDPDADFKATQNAGSHPNVAIAVYKGDCDAGVTYINVLTDVTTNLVATYPDITTKVTVFDDTDRIPNDGVQYAKDFPAEYQAITTEGLVAMSKDPGGKAILAKLYAVNAFQVIDKNFTMYSDFLAVLVKAGVDPASLIK